MLTFFPTPYQDELLHSVLARYHVRSGNQSPKVTIEDLFGNRTTRAGVCLQGNLLNLVKRLPALCNLTVQDIVEQNTLFPLFSNFLEREQAENTLDLMKHGNGAAIYSKSGISASSIVSKEFLYYCLDCYHEEQEKYCEAYWHRTHQVPGVFICPHHGTVLKKSKRSLLDKNAHEFIPAIENEISMEGFTLYLNDSEYEELLGISQDIYWMLNSNIRGQIDYQATYLRSLEDKGLATCSGRVKHEEFQESIISHYGNKVLNLLQSNVDLIKGNSWLQSIVRKHRYSFHPIRHVLIMRFLAGNASSFYSSTSITSTDIKKVKVRKVTTALKMNEVKKVEDKNKDKWLKLQIENPNYGKTELRKIAPGAFSWLYRNNREWLEKNSPKVRKAKVSQRLIIFSRKI